ncbi:MAG: amidohydrolase family protein, partial [bacterium]
MNNLLIANGKIVTLGKENKVIDAGAVYIENGLIKAVGSSDILRKQFPQANHLDAQNRVVMPGMICAHHHLYSTMARGMKPPGEPAENFVQILERLWWKLDYTLNEDDVYYSAIMPLIECMKNGTTTIIDHHASPGCRDGSLDIIEKAVLKSGLRACLCYEVSDRNIKGGGIEENVRFIKKCKNTKQSQVTAMMGLHASMTISPETLETCVGYTKDLDVGCHVHVAEDLADREDSLRKYGIPTATRLIQAGVGGEKSIFVHCIHIDE